MRDAISAAPHDVQFQAFNVVSNVCTVPGVSAPIVSASAASHTQFETHQGFPHILCVLQLALCSYVCVSKMADVQSGLYEQSTSPVCILVHVCVRTYLGLAIR